MLSSGKPEDSLRGLGLRRVHGLPRGVYGAPALYDFGVVAINELREHPSTLLLRLLGAGPTFQRALAELRRLPPEAIEVQTMLPVVVRYYRMAEGAEHKTDEQKEFLMETQDIVKELEQRQRQEGWLEAQQEGWREGWREGERAGRDAAAAAIRPVLLRLYEFRFGVVPEQVRSRIQGELHFAVLLAWTEIIALEVIERALWQASSG